MESVKELASEIWVDVGELFAEFSPQIEYYFRAGGMILVIILFLILAVWALIVMFGGS